jgi:hypothetical protein
VEDNSHSLSNQKLRGRYDE